MSDTKLDIDSVNDKYRIPNTKIEIIAWCEMPKPYKAEGSKEA